MNPKFNSYLDLEKITIFLSFTMMYDKYFE